MTLLKTVLRSIHSYWIKLMGVFTLDEAARQQVLFASAATYTPKALVENNVRISINLPEQVSRSIRVGEEQVYPDIIIWRPNLNVFQIVPQKAFLVEFIETSETLSQQKNCLKWKKIDSLEIACNVVVPVGEKNKVLNLFQIYGIQYCHIQTYKRDAAGRVSFGDTEMGR